MIHVRSPVHPEDHCPRDQHVDQGQRDRLFQRIGGRPVLSISEADDPCTVGSLFCLRVSDQQVPLRGGSYETW